jgi:hypothetical protein
LSNSPKNVNVFGDYVPKLVGVFGNFTVTAIVPTPCHSQFLGEPGFNNGQGQFNLGRVPERVEWADSEIYLILKTLVSIHSDSLCDSHSKKG